MRSRGRGLVRGEEGFALVAALWLLVAFSVLGVGFSLRARTYRLAAANGTEGAVARLSAEGALAMARSRLMRGARTRGNLAVQDPARSSDPWAETDTLLADTVIIGQGRAILAFEDLGAHLHLNQASEDDLRRFFRALRADYGLADRLAQSIADWRDADRAHRPRGGERELYLREGRAVLPADAPFADLADLQHVRGMTPELFERAAPFLTLQGSGRINLASAPREVLLSLPGFGEEAVNALLRAREDHRPMGDLSALLPLISSGPRETLQQALPVLQGRVLFEATEILVTATGWQDGSPAARRVEAVFVRAGDAAFLTWSRTE